MNSIKQVSFIGIFSLPLTLFGSEALSITEEPRSTLVAPQKDEYTTLTLTQLKHQLSDHKTLLLEGITPDNAYTWYDRANAYRHLFDNIKALVFAETIYHTLIKSTDLSDQIRSLSYRCLSKIKDRNGNTHAALQLALEAAEFGKNTDTYGQTLRYLGDLYYFGLQNEHIGCSYYLESLTWCQQHEKKKWGAQVCIGLGNARYIDKHHQRYTDWYLRAIKILGKDGDKNLIAQAYINLGNAGYIDKHHKSNIDWYLHAIKILGKDGDKNLIAQAYINLGNAGYIDEHHKSNIDWYLHAIKILGDDGDITLIAQAYINLGNAGYIDEHHQSNTDWYLQAINILGKDGDITLIAQAYINLGDAGYIDEHHQGQADWYLLTLDILGEHGDINLIAQAYIGLGNVTTDKTITPLQMSKTLTSPITRVRNSSQQHKSDHLYLRAITILGKDGDRNLIAKAYIGLGSYYCSQRKNEKGLKCYQKALSKAPESMKDQINEKIDTAQGFIAQSQSNIRKQKTHRRKQKKHTLPQNK